MTVSYTHLDVYKRQNLINICWTTGHISEDCAMAKVVPIFRKGDLKDSDNYRGVSMLNTCNTLNASILTRQLNAITAVSYTHLDVYKRQT